MYGRLALLRFFHHYSTFFGISKFSIQTACDNKCVLKNKSKLLLVKWVWSAIWRAKENYDCIRQIELANHKLLRRGIKISTKHIKGHQDKDKKFHQLSCLSQLNVLADELATLQREELELYVAAPDPTGPRLPSYSPTVHPGWSVCRQGVRHTPQSLGQLTAGAVLPRKVPLITPDIQLRQLGSNCLRF